MKKIKRWFKPDPETLHNLLTKNRWLWKIINNVPFLHDMLMKRVYTVRSDNIDSPPLYESDHEYVTLDATYNMSYYARVLPPVPRECPTPMGTAGKKELPDIDLVVKKFFLRKEFKPDPIGTSVLFSYFAQHFTHQFFKTDLKRGPGFQWGNHGVDVSHIYGKDKSVENKLRSFKDGKLKTQIIDGEEWPPYAQDTNVPMIYPGHVQNDNRFALGHEFFGLLPGLLAYGTIWMREHNRVCDIMKKEHPDWDDERIFQTSKLIILGETIKIVIEDYVQHLSNYHFQLTFNPKLLFGELFQYQNRISVEFNHLYHWHPLMPSEFNISGTVYSQKDIMFHPEILVKHGMRNFFTFNNHGPTTIPVVKQLIQHGRTLRFQSFNQYRKRFDLKPFKSFEELTGDKKLAKDLEELYGDIDALEFYVGLTVEKRRPLALFGSTLIEIGSPFSVKGLMANAICSPRYWKPSTFGGDVGFDIVNTATLKKLFCANIKGECPYVSFRVHDYVEGDVKEKGYCGDESGCHDEL
ncbi:hypothetical protein KUTeg_021525 [Tegillarca granosa]|uniref:Prostaglandin-endoperoxide synthase n=1 Tax=Tegillarca granosa TaxID=220873 RepID=A0ABQ9E3I4_TEGGR|nr:hypothetical protein KUTeg_021525 [Tegillarca granosa]